MASDSRSKQDQTVQNSARGSNEEKNHEKYERRD